MRRAMHFQFDGDEYGRFEAAARAAGYGNAEFARRLLRIGWRYEGAVGREEGLHFVSVPAPRRGAGGPRRARKGGRQRQQGASAAVD